MIRVITDRGKKLVLDSDALHPLVYQRLVHSISLTHYDLVRLTYQGDASPYTSNITLLFHESEDRVQLMMYNLINFAEEDRTAVLDEINMLNRQISGIKLYVDDSDYSITVFVSEDTVAEATLSAIGFMIGKTDAIYDMLKEYSI